MQDDELITAEEARRLEGEADALLRADAKEQGFIKKTYGYGKYAKTYGILTAHDIATIRRYEFPGDFNRLRRDEDHDDG
jgi:hypothetical protein